MNEHSSKQAREYAELLRDKCNLTGWGVMADMLDEYANLLEEQEKQA